VRAGERRKRGGEAHLVAALANGASVPAAARQAGLSAATVYRRLHEEPFRARIEEARAEIVKRAVVRLSATSVQAVDALRALLRSDQEYIRLAAATRILELGRRLREHEDLAERVRALEEQLAKGDPGWRPRTA
jgi:hypothetical protein